MNFLFLVLALLMVKHYVAEYCLYFKEMRAGLKKFFNLFGVFHVMIHAALTFFVLVYFTGPAVAGIAAGIELVAYYNVAYAIGRFCPEDKESNKYRVISGLAQLIHLLMYVAVVYYIYS